MAYVKNLFDSNFIQYASYVIRDRAIPEITAGLTPVQRRILHTLLKTDDGRFTKVANVVGKVMAYHPHGDASIYTALVNLANKELFIDKQGNFGNMYTGDGASAPRYIECRLRQITKDILNTNPRITQYVDTYDARDVEPIAYQAKLPLVLIMGAEGIAVGMSTNILSHNIHEVIDAEKKCLRGEKFRTRRFGQQFFLRKCDSFFHDFVPNRNHLRKVSFFIVPDGHRCPSSFLYRLRFLRLVFGVQA